MLMASYRSNVKSYDLYAERLRGFRSKYNAPAPMAQGMYFCQDDAAAAVGTVAVVPAAVVVAGVVVVGAVVGAVAGGVYGCGPY